jgi:hypothetical protein
MFNASRAMLCNYMYRLLSDLLETLKYLKIVCCQKLADVVDALTSKASLCQNCSRS